MIISLWKCTLSPPSQLLNVIFLPGGREAAWGESTELWAHEWAFDQGSPRADRFSHEPENLHFSSEASLAQDPQSLPELQGGWEVRQRAPSRSPEHLEGLPAFLAPAFPLSNISRLSGSLQKCQFLAPPLKDSDETVLGGTWGSVSQLSPGRCKTHWRDSFCALLFL